MLTEKVTKYGWDAATFAESATYCHPLRPATIDELIQQRNYLEALNAEAAATPLEMERFLLTQQDVRTVRQHFLEGDRGFCIIDGLHPDCFSRPVQRGIFYLMGRILGEPLVQNIQGEILVEVSDKDRSMKTGGRYHDTREGGSLHTDSPQFPLPPAPSRA